MHILELPPSLDTDSHLLASLTLIRSPDRLVSRRLASLASVLARAEVANSLAVGAFSRYFRTHLNETSAGALRIVERVLYLPLRPSQATLLDSAAFVIAAIQSDPAETLGFIADSALTLPIVSADVTRLLGDLHLRETSDYRRDTIAVIQRMVADANSTELHVRVATWKILIASSRANYAI